MSRLKKQHYKKIIALVIVFLFLVSLGVFAYSADKYVKRKTKLREKTTFTAQDTENLWSELGLEYIDLDISKAYFKSGSDLYVISEGFDSVEAEIKYLKQFKGNEKIEIGAALEHNHKGDVVSEIFNIKCTNNINCFTYEENGKYYLEFHKSYVYAGSNKLYEMFGLND